MIFFLLNNCLINISLGTWASHFLKSLAFTSRSKFLRRISACCQVLWYVLVKVRNVKFSLPSPDTSHRQSRSKGRSFTVSAVPESLEVSCVLTTQAQSEGDREEGAGCHSSQGSRGLFHWVEGEGNKARGASPTGLIPLLSLHFLHTSSLSGYCVQGPLFSENLLTKFSEKLYVCMGRGQVG